MENLHPFKEFRSRKVGSSWLIKVRCPNCLKRYAINLDEIRDSRPKFACPSCDKKFWIDSSEPVATDEVIGFPLEWLSPHLSSFATPQPPKKTEEVPPKTKPRENPILCPKCQRLSSREVTECPSCGVVMARWDNFQKLKREKEQGFSASPALRQAWEAVLDNYEDEKVHREFLTVCQQEGNWVYASRQYGRLLSAHGGNEVAKKMSNQVVALSQVALDTSKRKPQDSRMKYWRFSNLILFFSAALIGIGFFLEPWRNIVGVGVALIFFTLTFQNYWEK